MIRIFISVLLASVMPLRITQANGQRRRASSRPAQRLGMDAESLPRSFTGDDIVAVFSAMYSEMKPKGEYERSKEYNARVAAAADKYKDRVFFFRFKPPHMPGLNDEYAFYTTRYDADAQEMAVEVKGRTGWKQLEVTVDGRVSRSKHRASNRFGVSTLVTSYVGDLYDIEFDCNDPAVTVKFKIPASQARLARNNISVLFIGRPKMRKDVGKDSESMVKSFPPMGLAATMDSPYEDLTRSHLINMDVTGVWVYDRSTMRVLGKLNRVGI
jgi:hypothetical protein